MQTDFTKEQKLLRDVVAGFLKTASPTEEVRRLMASEDGLDPGVWQQLSREVGLTGTHIEETYGGSGLGSTELGIVCEEMGRRLLCGPFFASAVLAGTAVQLGATDSAKSDVLTSIATGEAIATLVVEDLGDLEKTTASFEVDGAMRVTGEASVVLDPLAATLLVVAVASGDGAEILAVEPQVEGVRIVPLDALDPTRKLGRVSFDDAEARSLGSLGASQLRELWDRAATALAHEMIGGAQHLLDSTVEYTKVRVQFGRPIGSFQALKHRCADLLMEVELARAATYHAARCIDSGEGEPWAPSMAKAMASDAYMSAARTAIQLRGGIGFTWENDTHLWFKRAKASEVLLGAPHVHRERMMRRIEEAAA